jgi:hypothetical protein
MAFSPSHTSPKPPLPSFFKRMYWPTFSIEFLTHRSKSNNCKARSAASKTMGIPHKALSQPIIRFGLSTFST